MRRRRLRGRGPAMGPETYAVAAGRRARGRCAVPPSKSVAQRYFGLALVGRLPLTIHRPLTSEDPRLFLDALARCGFAIERRGEALRLTPGPPPAGGDVFCGNGGTMFRFLTAALTTVPGRWRLDGVPRLRERPVGPLIAALRPLGAEIRCLEREGYAPLEITGGSLRGGRTTLDAGESSQYLSALLIAALAAREPVEVTVERLTSTPYVDLTFEAIAAFGGRLEALPDAPGGSRRWRVEPSPLAAGEVTVESDYSAAAYPAAAAALTGGPVVLEGLRRDSAQGDRRFLDLLAEMGARVAWRGAELVVEGGPLAALDADLSDVPDQVPTLAAVAPFARGTTVIRNVAHLRIKECDRLAAMARELGRLGVPVEERADGLVVPGTWAEAPPPSEPVEVETYGDHRIAMALALVGLRRPGVVIRAPQVVAKSYPAFWRDLERLLGG